MRCSFRPRATRVAPFLVAVLAAMVLAGCGGNGQADGGDGGGGPATAEFVAVDIDWDEAPDQVPAGEVNLVLENQGQLDHTLAFEGVEGGEPLVETAAGETGQATTQLEPGTYIYYCTVANHREAGMEGTLEVTE